jgi:hypothetical protein
LQDKNTSKWALILMGLWTAGGGMIIWIAGLKGISETESLTTGTLDEILNSRELYEIRRKIQAPKNVEENPRVAFERLMGPMLETARGLDLVDSYFGNRILQAALGESQIGTFWVQNLLRSNLTNVNLYTKFPSDYVVGNREAKSLTEKQRLTEILGFILKQQKELNTSTKVLIHFYERTHHTMHLKFRFEMGWACYALGDRNDSFNPDSPGNFSAVTKVPSSGWSPMQQDDAWSPGFGVNAMRVNLIDHLEFSGNGLLEAKSYRYPKAHF